MSTDAEAMDEPGTDERGSTDRPQETGGTVASVAAATDETGDTVASVAAATGETSDTVASVAAETVSPDAAVACPACDEPAPPDAKFCESCGADLAAAPADAIAAAPCVACGAPPQKIIEGGYCSDCGQKQPARRDHLEIDDGPVAAVTDRGKRHHRNEDATAIWSGPDRAVVVVCDGVSSTDRPDDASQAAADTACDHLRDYLTSEQAITGLSEPAPPDSEAVAAALILAIAAAHQAVGAVVANDPNAEPPSCTIVVGVVHWVPTPSVSVAWIGDSRGYWIDPDGTIEQVTSDHSWANQQHELGELDAAAIAADRRAHSITRWLGADAVDITPDIVHITRPGGGRWLACSDGLWNYADDNEAMGRRVAEFDGSPLELAQRLTTFARDAGGHDNITVAVASNPKASKDGEP